jgi:myo-inositol-1-phosphate synthase
MSKLGVVIVGLGGAVASTVVAGVEMIRRGFAPPVGLVTEKTEWQIAEDLTQWLDFAPLEDMVFGGWDLKKHSLYEACYEHKVLPEKKLDAMKAFLDGITPWPAVFSARDVSHGENAITAKSFREEIAILKKNVEDFKKQHGADRVVLVNLASTEKYLEVQPVHQTLAAFERGIDANDPHITPAMKYFYVANELGCPYMNFTPSLTNVPALLEHAMERRNPFAGMDGKTGQTLVKTVLGSMFRGRRLFIDGWYSTNILGNNDGKVLHSPENNKTKVTSKGAVLDSIVGYKVENHQVHIHYYKPRGDAKEAWDNIDLVGFGGVPMQMKVDFLCQDSVLAAPLVVDLVRLLDVAKAKGERGIQRQLSMFFKAPYTAAGETPEHDFFKQERMLLEWAKANSNKK